MRKTSIAVKIVTVFNAIQLAAMLFLIIGVINQPKLVLLFLGEILFVVLVNYFLIKGKKWAWIAFLIWFCLLTLSLETPFFAWSISFGLFLSFSLKLTLGSTIVKIGVDYIALLILIVHTVSYKSFTKLLDRNKIEEKGIA